MNKNHRRAWRQTITTSLVCLLFMGAFGQLPFASAQSVPSLPGNVDITDYLPQLGEIQTAWSVCMEAAGANKKQQKVCNDAAKKALKDLLDQIKADEAAHKHDHAETAPPATPEIPTEPLGDAPQVPPTTTQAATPVEGPSLDYRVLVIAADGTEPQLGAIKQTLDYLGTPYDILVSATEDLTADKLFTDDQANYYGVILTNGEAGYSTSGGYVSGLTPEEWNTLNSFEASFGIRQVTWYTWPNPTYGLGYPVAERDTSIAPIEGRLVGEGKTVFADLTLAPITIRDVYTYLAKPAGATTVPLISTADGYALASIYTYPDGRKNLAVTFDTNQYLVHAHQIGYGLVNWVTKGQFLGQHRVYIDPQIDDLFLSNDIWNVNDPLNMVETYRLNGTDFQKVTDWQKKQSGVTKDLKLTWAFNGEGTVDEDYSPDTLTPKVKSLQGNFKWINHTWTHLNLNNATYEETYAEIKQNLDLATSLKLSNFSPQNMVNPEISGFFNPEAMRAFADLGIKYTVGDTSRPELGTPSPNTAVYNQLQPSILMIPRRPSNLFYNVSTPAEWTSEYNHLYRAFWGRDLSYTEILSKESDVLLQYLMKGEIYPWMFHQSNVRFYDGSHSLLTDLLDMTLAKYKTMFRIPILSPRQDQIAAKVKERMVYNAAQITATYYKGSNVLKLSSDQTVIVPVTGVKYGSAVANYGGQLTSYVTVPGGQVITISMN